MVEATSFDEKEMPHRGSPRRRRSGTQPAGMQALSSRILSFFLSRQCFVSCNCQIFSLSYILIGPKESSF